LSTQQTQQNQNGNSNLDNSNLHDGFSNIWTGHTALIAVLESHPTMTASFNIFLDKSANSALWVVLPRLSHLTPQHEFLLTRIHFAITLYFTTFS